MKRISYIISITNQKQKIISYTQTLINNPICVFVILIFLINFFDLNNIHELSMLTGFFKTAQKIGTHTSRTAPRSGVQGYAVHRIHTPEPTTCSNEALNNNEPVVFKRKNKASPVVQHPEHAVDKCAAQDCETKNCETPCGEIVSSKSIEHYTHSEKKATDAIPFSNEDFDGKKKPIYTKKYPNPHETSGDSANPERDVNYTKKLREILKENDEKK